MKKAIVLFFLTCLCALPVSLWAQSLQISGRIVSKTTGNPLAGATVRLKGTDQATISDGQGNFTIKAKQGNVLVITYIGADPLEFRVGTDQAPVIGLQEKAGNLEDVVVVGYGTQKKSLVTGAISSVKAADLDNMPVTRADQALEGRVSGVTIASSNGAPGSAPTVNIRGITSINGNTPLYVVDGTIVDVGGLDYLNPADIASIEVLKDAASAAIYGSRGGAGVIIITTKKGREGPAKVSYEGYFGTQSPQRKLDLTNATQYATLRNESSLAAGNGIIFQNPQSLGAGTNWQNTIFSNALVENHDISVSGGTDKALYFTSFGYYDQQGIVAKSVSNYKRFNARINSSFKIKPWATFGENFGYSYIRSQGGLNTNSEFGGPLSSAINLDPTTPEIITDPTVLSQNPYSTEPVIRNGQGQPYAISKYVGQEITNPLAYLQTQQGNYGWSHNMVGNVYLNLEPIKGLKLTTSFNAKQAFYGNESFTPIFFLNSSTTNLTNTSFYRENDQGFIWNWDNTVSYTYNLGEHHFYILGGTSAQANTGSGVNGTYLGLPVTNFQEASMNYSLAPANRIAGGFEAQPYRISSLIARFTYNYAEKYLLTANFRRDGSSHFGPDNLYGPFPSISVGWVPTKEKFLLNNGVFNDLKIRAGYGVNGNDNLPPFLYVSTVSGGRNYPFGEGGGVVVGYSPNAPANPKLKWEQNSQADAGFDATIFTHFNASFDVFEKKTSGMLLQEQIPGYVGASGEPYGNIANMEDKGVELELGYNQRIGQVNLSVKGNISHITNQITNLGIQNKYFVGANFQASGYEISRVADGHPMDAFYGFKTEGIFQTQAQINNYVNKGGQLIQPNAKPGDFKYADLDGDGAITQADRTYIGNPLPDWTFGFNINAAYKNFDVVLFAQGVAGNQIFQGYRRLDITAANYMSTALDRWTGPGTSNNYPRLVDGDPNGNFSNPTSFYLQNGSYLKLKTLQLGYTLPHNLTSHIGFTKIRIYVSGNNLITLTKYNGFDPEIGGSQGIGTGNANQYGVDNGIYPQARSFLVGLNVGF